MRRLLHLAFAVWKTGRPFDSKHDPWEKSNAPTAVDGSREEAQAAGHTLDEPARSVVTAICASTVADAGPAVDGGCGWTSPT
jgi:hypothetical protein